MNGWWRGLDSNQRSETRQIYSLLPLATREPLRLRQEKLYRIIGYLSTGFRNFFLSNLVNNLSTACASRELARLRCFMLARKVGIGAHAHQNAASCYQNIARCHDCAQRATQERPHYAAKLVGAGGKAKGLAARGFVGNHGQIGINIWHCTR